MCKHRKVKCDETRPMCLRCHRVGHPCSYDVPEPPPSPQPQQPAFQPSSGLFSVADILNFEAFKTLIARWLVPYSYGHSELWPRAMARECMRDECIRNVVLGIGALLRVGMRGTLPGEGVVASRALAPPSTTAPLDPVHQQALGYYVKAISLMRTRVSKRQSMPPPRTMLLATILFAVFEMIQGSTETANNLLLNVFLQLKDSLSSLKPGLESAASSQIAGALDDSGVIEAEHLVPNLVMYNSISFPPHYAEKLWPTRPAKVDTPAITTRWPDAKASLSETMLAWQSHKSMSTNWMLHHYDMPEAEKQAHLDVLQQEQQTYVRGHQRFAEFFEEQMGRELDSYKRKHWRLAIAGVEMGSVLVSSCLDWDAHTRDLARAFISLESYVSEVITKTPTAETLFDNMSFPVLACLAVLARKCRDRHLRQRVLNTTRRIIGPQSDWDRKALLIGSEVLVDIEEESRDENGVIPPHGRYRWMRSCWSADNTRFNVTFMRVVSGEEKKVFIHRGGRFDHLLGKPESVPSEPTPIPIMPPRKSDIPRLKDPC